MTRETTRRRETLLAWVLAFVGRDPQAFRNKDFTEARRQLKEALVVEVVFVRTLLPKSLVDLIWDGEGAKAFEISHDEARFRRHVRQPTQSQVKKIHKWLVAFMAKARPLNVEKSQIIVSASLETEEREFLPIHYSRIPSQPIPIVKSDDFRRLNAFKADDLYVEAIAELLAAFGKRVRRCADQDCQTLFLKKGKKRHCSDVCALRLRMRTWRKRNRANANAISRRSYSHKCHLEREKRKSGKAKSG